MRRLIILGAALAVAACVNPSARIAGALTRHGLDSSRAQCIGDRLERDLSVDQLRQMAAAARAYGRGDSDPRRLTGSDLLRVAGELHDPAVPIAVGRAALGCGVRLSDVL